MLNNTHVKPVVSNAQKARAFVLGYALSNLKTKSTTIPAFKLA